MDKIIVMNIVYYLVIKKDIKFQNSLTLGRPFICSVLFFLNIIYFILCTLFSLYSFYAYRIRIILFMNISVSIQFILFTFSNCIQDGHPKAVLTLYRRGGEGRSL